MTASWNAVGSMTETSLNILDAKGVYVSSALESKAACAIDSHGIVLLHECIDC